MILFHLQQLVDVFFTFCLYAPFISLVSNDVFWSYPKIEGCYSCNHSFSPHLGVVVSMCVFLSFILSLFLRLHKNILKLLLSVKVWGTNPPRNRDLLTELGKGINHLLSLQNEEFIFALINFPGTHVWKKKGDFCLTFSADPHKIRFFNLLGVARDSDCCMVTNKARDLQRPSACLFGLW